MDAFVVQYVQLALFFAKDTECPEVDKDMLLMGMDTDMGMGKDKVGTELGLDFVAVVVLVHFQVLARQIFAVVVVRRIPAVLVSLLVVQLVGY